MQSASRNGRRRPRSQAHLHVYTTSHSLFLRPHLGPVSSLSRALHCKSLSRPCSAKGCLRSLTVLTASPLSDPRSALSSEATEMTFVVGQVSACLPGQVLYGLRADLFPQDAQVCSALRTASTRSVPWTSTTTTISTCHLALSLPLCPIPSRTKTACASQPPYKSPVRPFNRSGSC